MKAPPACFAGSVFCLLTFAAPAFAYEEDTHFQMTYVLLRSVGFTPDEAMIVAAVDQGMDDSPDVVAYRILPKVPEEWMWHALDLDGKMGANKILARKDQLFAAALNEPDTRNKLIRLGVFFHFQQDTWSHRRHYIGSGANTKKEYEPTHLSRTAYLTYKTPFGHAVDFHQPDRPPFDPVAAYLSLEDGVWYAKRFLREAFGRTPSPFLRDYIPNWSGKDDPAWPRNTAFFHQISISAASPNSARSYLLNLVHAQIETYKSSHDVTFRTGTADGADLDKTRNAFQSVWALFKPGEGSYYPDLVIPTTKQKEAQEFISLTTCLLTGALPSAPQFIGVGTDDGLWAKGALNSIWNKIPDSVGVVSVAAMRDGMLLGAGTKPGFSFYKRFTLSNWEQIENPGEVIAVDVAPDGTILGVGTDNRIYTRQSPDSSSKWTPAATEKLALDIDATPHGSFVVVEMNNTLSISNDLTKGATWYPIDSNGVIAAEVLQDESIVIVKTDYLLYRRAKLLIGNWEPVPNPGKVKSITEMPLTR